MMYIRDITLLMANPSTLLPANAAMRRVAMGAPIRAKRKEVRPTPGMSSRILKEKPVTAMAITRFLMY